VILRLTLTTAELVAESGAEWQALEQIVRLGEWTSGPRKDEWRLRYLAARLKIPLRVEGGVVLRGGLKP
jgi:hypothetical protein